MYCLFPSRPLFILSEAKNEEWAGSRKPEAGKPTADSLPASDYLTSDCLNTFFLCLPSTIISI